MAAFRFVRPRKSDRAIVVVSGTAGMTRDVVLSFCIPTYNRAPIVSRLVVDMLASDEPSIEVVVLDNGSSDDTLERLKAIRDGRLSVYTNGVNKGGHYNVMNVMDKGCGRYVVFCTDKDHVDKDKIAGFVSFLRRNPVVACGYCEFESGSTEEFELIPAGYEAVRRVGYIGRHPTGYFFKNELLKSTRFIEKFADFNTVGNFPFEFPLAELSVLGEGAIYKRPVFLTETKAEAAKAKSSSTSGKSKDAFFLPEIRLKTAIRFLGHMQTLAISPKGKDSLAYDVFKREILGATLGYRAIMKDELLCLHYHTTPCRVGAVELLRIGARFFAGFLMAYFQSPRIGLGRKFFFAPYLTIRYACSFLFGKR